MFFFKQKTAYEMRISDWSSDVCSSDLGSHQDDQREDQEHDVALDLKRIEEAGVGSLPAHRDDVRHSLLADQAADRSRLIGMLDHDLQERRRALEIGRA